MSESGVGLNINSNLLHQKKTLPNQQKNTLYSLALHDLFGSIKHWHLWTNLAFSDIRRRYRRTVLGPFWTTLSLFIFILSAGIVFSKLWKMEISVFLPFFCSGYICWVFVSTIIAESCTTFVSTEGILKQIALPYPTFAWLLVFRNLLVLAHHLLVYVIIAIVLGVPINANCFLLLPAMILLCLTGFWVSIILGMMCARFRDIQQVVNSMLQISMFVTPIFWAPTQLEGSRHAFFVNGNPLYHYVNLIRAPLLGQSPSLLNWLVVAGITVVGLGITFLVFARLRQRLIFWL